MRRFSVVVVSMCVAAWATGCATDGMTVGKVGSVSVGEPAAQSRLLVPFEKVVLANGATVLLARKADVPLVALSARLHGGAVTDTPAKAGLAALTAALLEKGAAGRDARTFADTVADVGGIVSSAGGRESVQVSAEFLAEDTALMIELVLDMLMTPQLPIDEFQKLQTRSIQSLKAARDGDPRSLVSRYGAAFLFGEHVYGRPVGGLEDTLASLTHQDILDHHRQHYGADRLVLAVVGDIDPAEVRSMLASRLNGWARASATLPAVSPMAPVKGARVLLVDKPDATQSYFWMGNVGVANDFAQRAELDVANTIFGGRFTSMLNTALRIESGLTYGASSRLSRYAKTGSVAISSYTATDTTVAAMDLALETLTRFRAQAPSAELVASARNYIRGQNPLGYETAGQMAGHLSSLAFYGRERDYVDGYDAAIAAVDGAGLMQVVADVYPGSDELVTVVIGNAAAIRDDLARYGVVEEMSITAPAFAP